MNKKVEDAITTAVQDFVKTELNGRYGQFASDQMLVALIVYQLGNPLKRNPEKSIADAIVEGDGNEAYHAVCWIFEHVLEHKCGAVGNGHHVAQNFASYMGHWSSNVGVK